MENKKNRVENKALSVKKTECAFERKIFICDFILAFAA